MATTRVSAEHLTYLRTRAVTSGLDGVHMTSQTLIALIDEIDEHRAREARSEIDAETIRHSLNAAKLNLAARGTSLFEIEAALDALPPKPSGDWLESTEFVNLLLDANPYGTGRDLRLEKFKAAIREHFTPKETDR